VGACRGDDPSRARPPRSVHGGTWLRPAAGRCRTRGGVDSSGDRHPAGPPAHRPWM